jgi:hypothetical protein
VAVFARRDNNWPLLIFDGLSGKKVKDITIRGVYQNASPAFSPDGKRVTFEGNRDGVVDLFEIDLETKELRNLTQDEFFDANPWYAADGKTLLYNRRVGEHWKLFSVDLEDPSKKTQLTFGPYNEIQPSYSRDGKTIHFSSDRGEYGVFNLFSLDLETGDMQQYTDVVGGCFAPVEVGQRGDETILVFTAFYRGMFRLYRMALRAPVETIDMAQRLEEPVEAEPFEPDMRLKADDDKKLKFKVKWDIEAPQVGVGVANDGTFLANVGVSFTDLMGDQRILISAASVSDFQSYMGQYVNLKNRYTWGATVFDYRDFIVSQSSGARIERSFRATGANVFFQFPQSRYYRVDLTTGITDASFLRPAGFNPQTGQTIFENFDDLYAFTSIDYVGDTTRYQRFGPFQGKRFVIGVDYGPRIGGDIDGYVLQYNLDFRAYKQVTRRSVLAWRIAGLIGDGTLQNAYSMGGINQLRGYEFRQFNGSRMAWSNMEFRFPLVDELRFPVLALQEIRGFFFLDVGTAWYDSRAFSPPLSADAFYDPEFGIMRADYSDPQNPEIIPFEFWDSENGRFQDLRGSYGAGFQFYFIGGLQFNWIWAKRIPYTQYVYQTNPVNGFPDTSVPPVPQESRDLGIITEFYIAFDW